MGPNRSSMNAEELLREFIILNKVRENIEHLIVYNSNLLPCMDRIEQEIKQIKGQLFFKYHPLNKVDLHALTDPTELHSRMMNYLDPPAD